MAARPRTLPAAIAPVLVGTAAAVEWAGELPLVGAFIAALIGSIFIQIGTNLANDYSDAKRGADTADRLGPVRVTSAGLVTPQRVLNATWVAFGGRGRRRASTWPTVAGLVILAGRRRSRSPPASSTRAARGPTATRASARSSSSSSSAWSPSTAPTTCSSSELDSLPFWLSISVGLLSTAILVVNNVRDIETDRRAGKRTLAVRLGRERTRPCTRPASAAPSCVLLHRLLPPTGPLAALHRRCSPRRWPARPLRPCSTRTDGPSLNGALAGTGALLAAFSVLRLGRPADRRLR